MSASDDTKINEDEQEENNNHNNTEADNEEDEEKDVSKLPEGMENHKLWDDMPALESLQQHVASVVDASAPASETERESMRR